MEKQLFHLIETAHFRKQADALLTLDELESLRLEIALNPEQGDLIKGGSGLRKVRFSFGGRGKRGGARVIYWLYVKNHTAYLLDIYAKNDRQDMTPAQIKELATLIEKDTFR